MHTPHSQSAPEHHWSDVLYVLAVVAMGAAIMVLQILADLMVE